MYVFHISLEVSSVNRTKVVRAIRSITGSTLVQPGCRRFCLYCDVDNDDSLILIEEWDSQDAFNDHIRSDDFRIILSLMDSSKKTPEVAIHEVSNTAGLDLVKQLRTAQ